MRNPANNLLFREVVMATKLSAFIAVLVVAVLTLPPQIAPVGAPAGTVVVKDDNRRDASRAPVVLAQYTRCWNGRCR